MKSIRAVTTAVALTLASFVGCQRGGDDGARASPVALTAAEMPVDVPLSNDTSVAILTNAGCDREVACGNVGRGLGYGDRDACARQLGREAAATLRPEECPAGVDQSALSSCVEALRNASCGDAREGIGRIAACRRAELCV